MTIKQIVDAPKGTLFAFNAERKNFGIFRKNRTIAPSKRDESYFLYHTGIASSQMYGGPKRATMSFDPHLKLPIPFDENSKDFYSTKPEDFRKSKIGILTNVFCAEKVDVSWGW